MSGLKSRDTTANVEPLRYQCWCSLHTPYRKHVQYENNVNRICDWTLKSNLVWDRSLVNSSDQRLPSARDVQQAVRTVCEMILQLFTTTSRNNRSAEELGSNGQTMLVRTCRQQHCCNKTQAWTQGPCKEQTEKKLPHSRLTHIVCPIIELCTRYKVTLRRNQMSNQMSALSSDTNFLVVDTQEAELSKKIIWNSTRGTVVLCPGRCVRCPNGCNPSPATISCLGTTGLGRSVWRGPGSSLERLLPGEGLRPVNGAQAWDFVTVAARTAGCRGP